MNRLIITIFALFVFGASLLAQQLAFPTAEGYGKYSKGGRGGTVYEVTNLNDSGEGSLRIAIDASEPRTVVFRVSGTIILESPLSIKHPYITVAGQTAPGDGITIRKHPLNIGADHVIVRYIRVRLGDESGEDYDAISSRYTKHLILDHVSASWSVDECMSIYHCDSITVQWCIISESMSNSNHVKGSHGFGGIWGSNFGTYHHNLLAHHTSRNPRMASGSGNTDFRNNVIYNWGYQSLYGGEKYQKGNDKFNFSNFNIVANYYKPGPATKPGEVSCRIANPSFRSDEDYGKWHITKNVVEGNKAVSKDNWNGGVQTKLGFEKIKLEEAWQSMEINQQSAKEAYKIVLKNAGAILPQRDIIDKRILEEVRNGSATFEGKSYVQEHFIKKIGKACGIIDTQNDVGGWPELRSLLAPVDTDHDGMSDDWEKRNGLNPANARDRNKLDNDGYTMLEKYINNIVENNVNAETKPRVMVTSDGEIDDECSLVRFLLYTNEWDVEGIITSSSQYHWHGHRWAGDDWAVPYLDAYAEVYPNLLLHDKNYPSPEYLKSVNLLGNVAAEGEMDSITPGSQHIVKVLLDESDDRPIWIQAWGGTGTIARALKTIEEKRPEKMEYVANKMRLFFIWEQDSTYQTYIGPHWGKYNIPTIICDQFWAIAYQWDKIIPDDKINCFKVDWMKSNILKDHGALCSLY